MIIGKHAHFYKPLVIVIIYSIDMIASDKKRQIPTNRNHIFVVKKVEK